MRRYQPLLLITFFLLVTVITGSTYLSGYAGKADPDNIKSITVYTTLPIEQITILGQEYEKTQHVRINLIPLSEQDLLSHLKLQTAENSGDIIIADSKVLEQAKRYKMLVPYTSEQTDIIPERFNDEENYWTGLWYDPMVFAVNQDFMKSLPKTPSKWNDIVSDNKYRICITDFFAADGTTAPLSLKTYTLPSISRSQFFNKCPSSSR